MQFMAETSLGKIAIFDGRIAYQGAPVRSPLNDPLRLRNMLRAIARAANLHIVQEAEHRFTPFGITMTYILSESHVSIHTWPEKNAFALDIYSCRADYSEQDIGTILRRALPIQGLVVQTHLRQV